jgi:hypothetical protein
MPGFIPDRKSDFKNDDVQDIERDMTKLANRYLRPIDSIRSIVRPNHSTSKNSDECVYEVEKSDTRPLESRAHAFFRFIGFPVAVKSGEFYNPGFDPSGSLNKTKRSDINKKFLAADIKTKIDQREEWGDVVKDLFGRQDLSASVYALLISTHVRPIVSLEDGIDSLDVDNQVFDDAFRKQAVDEFFTRNDKVSQSDIRFLAEVLGATYAEGIHILKPFVVDPAIDCMAMPIGNRVAVPFLKNKEDLKVDENTSVLRPGIELIIRERLRASQGVDVEFIETVRQILDNELSPNAFYSPASGTTINGQTLISTVSALLGTYNFGKDELNKLKNDNLSRVQTEIISQLVRTLKRILSTLHDSIITVLKSQASINWIPIPNPEGPELGAKKAILRTLNMSSTENEIDKSIIALKIQSINARYQKTERQDEGEFASPFKIKIADENLDLIDNSLKDAEQKRDNIANDAFVAMGNIELIMGEASGLGLIDVLAIYIALWSMDEASLISLLDNESFQRLIDNFGDLVIGSAAVRFGLGEPEKDIVTALNDFESKLKNVLSFAQTELGRKFDQDGEGEGGDIYPDA